MGTGGSLLLQCGGLPLPRREICKGLKVKQKRTFFFLRETRVRLERTMHGEVE